MHIFKARDIGRTVLLTRCAGVRLNLDTGDIEDYEALIYGEISASAATKYLRKRLKDDSIIINQTETDTDYYSVTLEQFLAMATKRED